MKKLIPIFLAALCVSCTTFEVAEIDPLTGYFTATHQAEIVTNKDIDLDDFKSLLLIGESEFIKGQLENIDYFDMLITHSDLEKEIIKNNLQEVVPSVRDQIGLNKAYRNYQKFLYFKYDKRGTGNEQYGQFILTNPGDLEDIFMAEIKLDMWLTFPPV